MKNSEGKNKKLDPFRGESEREKAELDWPSRAQEEREEAAWQAWLKLLSGPIKKEKGKGGKR